VRSTEKLASYPRVRKRLDGAAVPADVAIIDDAQVLAAGIEAFAEVGVTDLAVAIHSRSTRPDTWLAALNGLIVR